MMRNLQNEFLKTSGEIFEEAFPPPVLKVMANHDTYTFL
ncbi:hypothetical protein pah_c023o001 [Parachlamydia acanthamoebae str. Hall's coccus]|nr:hypothetical protein pah_c023o001 [Parachlamydia acanthamoebae str. Hall's coccus]